MALTQLKTGAIADDAVTEDKIANAINTARAANTAKDLTALSASNLTSGTVPDARFPATLPAASAANLTSVPAANITGTLPAISGANLTNLPASGKFKQIVGAVYSSNISYNSTTTYADTGLTCNITTSASGHAGVFAIVAGALGGVGNTSGGETAALMNLVRDTTELTYVGNGGWGGNISGNQVSNHNSNCLIFYDDGTSASTTYTYKVQFKKTSDTANATWNNYNGRSLIYLIEVGS